MPIEIQPTEATVARTVEETITATRGYLDKFSADGVGADGTRTKPVLDAIMTPYAVDGQGRPTFATTGRRVYASDIYAAIQYVPQMGMGLQAVFAGMQAVIAYLDTVRRPVMEAAIALAAQRSTAAAAAKAAYDASFAPLQAARATTGQCR
jgi:hypothetical protein